MRIQLRLSLLEAMEESENTEKRLHEVKFGESKKGKGSLTCLEKGSFLIDLTPLNR